MVASGISATITSNAWSRYQHTFAGNAQPNGTDDDGAGAGMGLDFDTDLMRLATGGALPARN